jgi:hypothetical protein
MNHLSHDLVDAAADGVELPPQAADHLRSCESCRVQVGRVLELRAQLAALPRSIEPLADRWPSLRDAIRARAARRRTLRTATVFALAAAALFAVVRVTREPESGPSTSAAELADLRAIAPAIVVEAAAANLTILDGALQELESHARADRENAEVRLRIDDLRRKRAALLRLAGTSSGN